MPTVTASLHGMFREDRRLSGILNSSDKRLLEYRFCPYTKKKKSKIILCRVKSGNFGHQVNLDNDLVSFIFQLLE